MPSISRRDYKNICDYLQHLYQCAPFARAGIEHPVKVYYPAAAQVADVDSLLDPTLPRTETRDFAVYDYSYLHNLQNSKSGLYDGATFTLKHIREKPLLRLRGAIGRYFDMLATCAAFEHELRDAAAEGGMRAPARTTFHRQAAPQTALTHGLKRSAAIGIGTLTVCRQPAGYRAILARRSQQTVFDSGLFHVLPAMMFQPTTSDFAHPQEWSIKHQILREVLEELFNMPEEHAPPRWDFFYEHPALLYLQRLMAEGKAGLYLTGLSLNLLTLRPEINTLLLIHDPQWHARITAADSDIPLATAAETLRGSLVSAAIGSDAEFLAHFPADLHLQMPAQATVTMWLGIDLARQLIAARG